MLCLLWKKGSLPAHIWSAEIGSLYHTEVFDAVYCLQYTLHLVLIVFCNSRCISDIDVMKNFVHLRYVYLPHNRIKSLLALNKFQYLILLDVGHNRIETPALIPKLDELEVWISQNVLFFFYHKLK